MGFCPRTARRVFPCSVHIAWSLDCCLPCGRCLSDDTNWADRSAAAALPSIGLVTLERGWATNGGLDPTHPQRDTERKTGNWEVGVRLSRCTQPPTHATTTQMTQVLKVIPAGRTFPLGPPQQMTWSPCTIGLISQTCHTRGVKCCANTSFFDNKPPCTPKKQNNDEQKKSAMHQNLNNLFV